MAQYAIVAFPDTRAKDAIESVRRRLDPLASMIAAHMTLVFPFELGAMTVAGLRSHVERTTSSVAKFEVSFGGISAEPDGYVFLNIERGADRVVALHDNLYTGVLAPHRSLEQRYRPHITLARLYGVERVATVVAETEMTLSGSILAVIDAVVAFRIDGPNEGRVEFTVTLPSADA